MAFSDFTPCGSVSSSHNMNTNMATDSDNVDRNVEYVADKSKAAAFFDQTVADNTKQNSSAYYSLDNDEEQNTQSSSNEEFGIIRFLRPRGINFHPFIRTVQKIVLYETRSVRLGLPAVRRAIKGSSLALKCS